jgi:hypothetical protein
MKNKCFNIAWLIAILFSFTACNDFLDIQPVGKVMPKTGQEFRDLLTEAYSAIPSDRGMATFRSDELTLVAFGLCSFSDIVFVFYDGIGNIVYVIVSLPTERKCGLVGGDIIPTPNIQIGV